MVRPEYPQFFFEGKKVDYFPVVPVSPVPVSISATEHSNSRSLKTPGDTKSTPGHWKWLLLASTGVCIIFIASKIDRKKEILDNCYIISGNSPPTSINLREGCDYRSCSNDPSTIYLAVDGGTTVSRDMQRESVFEGRFEWVPVTYSGLSLFVSRSKLQCGEEASPMPTPSQ